MQRLFLVVRKSCPVMSQFHHLTSAQISQLCPRRLGTDQDLLFMLKNNASVFHHGEHQQAAFCSFWPTCQHATSADAAGCSHSVALVHQNSLVRMFGLLIVPFTVLEHPHYFYSHAAVFNLWVAIKFDMLKQACWSMR